MPDLSPENSSAGSYVAMTILALLGIAVVNMLGTGTIATVLMVVLGSVVVLFALLAIRDSRTR